MSCKQIHVYAPDQLNSNEKNQIQLYLFEGGVACALYMRQSILK